MELCGDGATFGRRISYHFKKARVSQSLKAGSTVRVFARGENAIKKEIGCLRNVWVNSAGIEARLIAMFHPEWNSHGKKK